MTGYIFGTGGGSGTDVSDTTLLQNEAITGKYFYLADGTKVRGTMPIKEGITAQPTTSEQTLVPAGTYAKGDQKIAAIKTQSRTVTPTTSQQIITPSSGYYLSRVTVNGVSPQFDDSISLMADDDEYSYYEMVITPNINFTPCYIHIYIDRVYTWDLLESRDWIVGIYGMNTGTLNNWDGIRATYLVWDNDLDWEFDERKFDGSVTWNGESFVVSSNSERFVTVSGARYYCDLLGF